MIPRVLPRGRNATDREVVRLSQRVRMMEALSAAIDENGYAATTIADIVARAGVGKPAFYDNFADKEACFVAIFDEAVAALLGELNASLETNRGAASAERLDAAVRTIVRFMASDLMRARILLVEPERVGGEAIQRSAAMRLACAQLYVDAREHVRRERPQIPPIGHVRTLAIVGALIEPLRFDLLEHGGRGIAKLEDELVEIANVLALWNL